MTIRRGRITPDAAAKNPDDLRQHLHDVRTELNDLHAKLGMFGFDPDRQTLVSVKPPFAQLAVIPRNGVFILHITNPEFLPHQAGQRRLNRPLTPLVHEISSAPDISFSKGVVTFPPTTQTVLEFSQFGASSRCWRVRSSYDGSNWNEHVPKGPFQS